MEFGTYFRLTSYTTVAAAALALFVAGGVGVWLAGTFAVVMVAAWKLEGTRWQLSERVALVVILASLPLFYLDWRILTVSLDLEFLETGRRTNVEVAVLAHLILFLSAVKLLQRKADLFFGEPALPHGSAPPVRVSQNRKLALKTEEKNGETSITPRAANASRLGV